MLRSLFFQVWGSLMSMKYHTRDPQLRVPPGGLVLRIFTLWKNPSSSVGFEPANLGSRGEHITLRQPRPTRAYHIFVLMDWIFYTSLIMSQSCNGVRKMTHLKYTECKDNILDPVAVLRFCCSQMLVHRINIHLCC